MHMATLNRFTVDLVTEDELSQRRLDILAGELSEWLHLLGVEVEDEMENVSDKFVSGHVHDATESRCRTCAYQAQDSKNGDVVSEK